ncbi:MAG: hypothetical protein JO369_04700 [Paucibacter sp.]|nr:hypothetical protein [Roseateles sp.]
MSDISAAQRRKAGRQSGAATLVVVMMLFFIMAFVAAYANRNQLLELQTASQYVRVGVASEMADAGLEWTLAMLNGQPADASCLSGGDATFRQRFVKIDPISRIITVKAGGHFTASCVKPANDPWTCQCPAGGIANPQAGSGDGTEQPAFGIVLMGATAPKPAPKGKFSARPGVLRINAYGCSDSQMLACKGKQDADAPLQIGAVRAHMYVALLPALAEPPPAPLLVGDALAGDIAALGLHNSSPETAGLLAVTGAPLPPILPTRIDTVPGAAAQEAMVGNRADLAKAVGSDTLFRRFMGMTPDAYRGHPALHAIDCASSCMSAAAQAYRDGARMIWIRGAASLDGNTAIGSNDDPVVLVIDGDAQLKGPIHLHGLLYVRGKLDWSVGPSNTAALMEGALISEGSAHFSGPVDLSYRYSVLQRLANGTGSFVHVAGSWTDTDN